MSVENTFLVIDLADVRKYLEYEELEQLLFMLKKLKRLREDVNKRKPLRCLVVEDTYHGYDSLLKEIERGV